MEGLLGMIGLIVAYDNNKLIGLDNSIPWSYPEDIKRFKEITTGSVVIMGRKTFESIGKCLPNRINIVVTSKHEKEFPNEVTKSGSIISPLTATSLQQALNKAKSTHPNKDIWIIGGAGIYKEALDSGVVQVLEISRIQESIKVGNKKAVYFPNIPPEFNVENITVGNSGVIFQRLEKYDPSSKFKEGDATHSFNGKWCDQVFYRKFSSNKTESLCCGKVSKWQETLVISENSSEEFAGIACEAHDYTRY